MHPSVLSFVPFVSFVSSSSKDTTVTRRLLHLVPLVVLACGCLSVSNLVAQPPSGGLQLRGSAFRNTNPQPPAPLPTLDTPPTLAVASVAPQPAASGPAVLRSNNGIVKTIQNIRVPAIGEGQIIEMLAVEGNNVQKGDLLAVLDDTQVNLAVSLRRAEEKEAELNAQNDVNLRDAENTEKLAAAHAESARDLRRQGATTYYDMKEKELEAVRATLRIELSHLQADVAQVQHSAKRFERELAEYELSRRKVLAPFDGFIENRIAQLGEWVQPGTPILQLVQLDKVRVEGDIDSLRFPGQILKGTPVRVYVYARSPKPGDGDADTSHAVAIDGRIGFVSSEIDIKHCYRIWVEIENQRIGDDWLLKPGMEAQIDVFPNSTVN